MKTINRRSIKTISSAATRKLLQSTIPGQFAIHYRIILERGQGFEDTTVFAGFSRSLVSISHVFAGIASMPSSVFELYATPERIAVSRIFGASMHHVAPVTVEHARLALPSQVAPVVVMIAHPRVVDDVIALSGESELPPLVFTAGNGRAPTIPSLADLTNAALIQHLAKVRQRLRLGSAPWMRQFEAALKKLLHPVPAVREQPTKRLSAVKIRHHFVTRPNEIALMASGIAMEPGDTIPAPSSKDPGDCDAPYVAAIVASADAVDDRRRELAEGKRSSTSPPFDAILWAPTMYRGWYHDAPHTLRAASKTSPHLWSAVRALSEQKSYLLVSRSRDFPKLIDGTSPASTLIAERAMEVECVTNVISLAAADSYVPTWRLPARAAMSGREIEPFARSFRANSPRQRRGWPRQFAAFQARLRRSIPDEIYTRLLTRQRLKLVADAPLELLPCGDIPLSLHAEVSRVPTTPGNIFIQTMTNVSPATYDISVFQDVLIISGLHKTDPLQHMLETTISSFTKKQASSASLRIVNASNEKAVVDALNRHHGGVVVFYGHGSWRHDVGSIMIGGFRLDTFWLRGRARIPPVAVLAVCDGHPVDASHASPANGLLASGAQTVLGSLLPVNAAAAAMLVGRLLLRLQQWLPIMVSRLGTVRWSTFFLGMMRMSYATDIAHALMSASKLDQDAYGEGMARVNLAINTFDPAWRQELVTLVASMHNCSNDAAQLAMRRRFSFTEAMAYVSLGSPERILIDAIRNHGS